MQRSEEWEECVLIWNDDLGWCSVGAAGWCGFAGLRKRLQTGEQEALGDRLLGHDLLAQSVQLTHGTVDGLLLRRVG